MTARLERAVQVTLCVTVWVDPTNRTLFDIVMNRRGGSIAIAICDEVLANLKSVPYVMTAKVAERPKETATMTVKFLPNDKGNPPGKLADAELHFGGGPLDGLKLVGFAIWERRAGGRNRNVTFPARQYSVNGERRSFSLLRPIGDSSRQDKLRDVILEAYKEHESEVTAAL